MMRQRIQFTCSHDNVRLAWAQCGSGPALVKASNWLTHLQHDWTSPVWRHWMEFLAGNFKFIRFDERGCGMSDREIGDVSDDTWLPDLECVVDAARINEQKILLGLSQGVATAIRYAVKYPERVSHLILYGGYSRGWQRGGDSDEDRYYDAIIELMNRGWDDRGSVFRRMFANQFIPDANEEQIAWFDELCRITTSGDVAARLMDARARVNVTDCLTDVRVPTLVVHAHGDQLVPLADGRQLATAIPGAEFVELDSRNHVLLSNEPAWAQIRDAVLTFTGQSVDRPRRAKAQLTPREEQILLLLRKGMANTQIAMQLDISEKTVRNHLTRLYRKLGVRSRTEAVIQGQPQDE